jgi:hypothetical protein
MNSITPKQIYDAFQYQVVQGNIMPNNPLTLAYFTEKNIAYLRDEIQRRLREYTGEPNIKLVLTQEFAQTMVDTALRNQFFAYDVERGLGRINQWTINHETEIIMLSMRKRKQYERQILKGDRMRVYPYGLGDRTLHVRGENGLTQSPYQLNHPWKSQYQQYLKDVLMVDCPTRPSNCPINQVKYPNP